MSTKKSLSAHLATPPQRVERGERVLENHFEVRRVLDVVHLKVRIHFIIVMIRWTGLAPWEWERVLENHFDVRRVLDVVHLREFIDHKTSMTTD